MSAARRADDATWCWALFVAALALRLVRLGHEPLWFDEAYTALKVTRPATEILAILRQEANAPLYYLLLRAWTWLAGDGVWALRLPSAVAGALAAPLLLRVGAELDSRAAGRIAGLFAVVSPIHVHYSQEARMYTLVPLLAVIALMFVRRLEQRPVGRVAVLLGAVLLGGLYTHYYFLFFLPVLLIAGWPSGGKRTAPYAVALAVAAAGFAPWLPTLLHQTANRSTAWIAEFWGRHAIVYAIPWSLECLGPGALFPDWQSLKLASSGAMLVASLTLAAFVLASTVAGALRRGPAASAPRLLLGALLLPLAGALAASIVVEPVYVVARHDLIVWGPYLLAAGIACRRLGRVGRGIAVFWIALSIGTLVPHYAGTRGIRNYTDMGQHYAERLAAIARPGELLVFTAGTRTTTEYYLRDGDRDLRLASFPPGNDEHLGWVHVEVYSDASYAATEATAFARLHLDTAPPPPAVWITAPKSPGTDALLREFARRGYAPDRARSETSLLCLARDRPVLEP